MTRSDLDEIYKMLTEAIRRAEFLEDREADPFDAFFEVAILEEEAAKLVPATDPEGMIARRGALRASLKAHRFRTAKELLERYTSECPPSSPLANELQSIYDEYLAAQPERLIAVRAKTWDGLVLLALSGNDISKYHYKASQLAERLFFWRNFQGALLVSMLNRAMTYLKFSGSLDLLGAFVRSDDEELQITADSMIHIKGSPMRLTNTDEDFVLNFNNQSVRVDRIARHDISALSAWLAFCERNWRKYPVEAEKAKSDLLSALG